MKKLLILLLVSIFILSFGFRWIGLGTVMTADEERWVLNSLSSPVR